MRKKTGMSKKFFDEHITPFEAYISPWGKKELFSVIYRIKIGWIETEGYDRFIVKLESSETLYRLNVSRDTYLSEQEIEIVLAKEAFSSTITPIMPIESLKYSSKEKALKALQRIAKTEKMKSKGVSYFVPGKLPRKDGYPYLLGFGTIDEKRNRCIRGYLNLVTGEGYATEDACWDD